MSDMCTDNRFELIEKYKKELVEATNIETSPEEMQVLDNILFRFWQMGWLDSIDRMLLVKETAKTLMHSVGDSVSANAFRNAGRLIQNAIDGEAPDELGRTLASCISCANEHRQLAEWLKLLKRILESGDCNGCGIKKVCNVRPEWGEQVRYNCPMFVREEVKE